MRFILGATMALQLRKPTAGEPGDKETIKPGSEERCWKSALKDSE